jgi:SAM-dependent methyltransferase
MTLTIEYDGCPLCGGAGEPHRIADCTHHPWWSEGLPRELVWHRCLACGHVHTRDYWSAEGEALLFRRALPSQVVGGDPDAKRMTWQPVVRGVAQMLGGASAVAARGPSWVDAGCGDGALVMTAAEYGFRSLGIDARAETVGALHALGYAAQLGDFMTAPIDAPVDVLSMMDVLEHLPFPGAALERAHELLVDGGVIVISLPDSSSASWRIMEHQGANPYWGELEHFHNFSRASLTALLERHGFATADFGIAYRYKAQIELYATKVPVGR